MVFGILVEADRYVGGVGVFNEMRVFSIHRKNETDELGDNFYDSV